MALDAYYHAVVPGTETAVQGIARSDSGLHSVLSAGTDEIEACVAFTDDCFPYQDLCRHQMRKLIRVGCILGSPGCRDVSLIAVLHDAPQKDLDGIRRDRVVIAGGIVVPEVLAKARIRVSDVSCYAWLNAVAYLPVIGILGMSGVNATTETVVAVPMSIMISGAGYWSIAATASTA